MLNTRAFWLPCGQKPRRTCYGSIINFVFIETASSFTLIGRGSAVQLDRCMEMISTFLHRHPPDGWMTKRSIEKSEALFISRPRTSGTLVKDIGRRSAQAA